MFNINIDYDSKKRPLCLTMTDIGFANIRCPKWLPFESL